MSTFDLPRAELAFEKTNRCLFCFSKVSSGVFQQGKIFPATKFNEVWNHLVPEEELEFSVTPPLCTNCINTVENLYAALIQLTEATVTIRTVITEVGRNSGSSNNRFTELIKDLKQAGVGDRSRKGAIALLEKLGHDTVFEEDYQAWFPDEVETIGFKKEDYADKLLFRNPSPESDAGSNFDEGGVSPHSVDSGPGPGSFPKTVSSSSPVHQKRHQTNLVRKSSRIKSKRISSGVGDADGGNSDHDICQKSTEYVTEQKKAKPQSKRKRLGTSRPVTRSKVWRGYFSRPQGMINKSFACDYCLQYIPIDTLREHIRSHVGDYIINCPNSDCPLAFTTTRQLMHHTRKRPSCRRLISAKDYLTCERCGHKAHTSRLLLNHHLRLHEEEKKPFPCPVENCAETYSNRQAVQCHIWRHTSWAKKGLGVLAAPPLHQRCRDCRFDIHQDKMKDHLESVHQIPSGSIASCHVCPHLFSNWNQLLDHFGIHLRTEEICCSMCPNLKFNKISVLKQHYFGKHQIGSPLTCDKCPYTCWNGQSMLAHSRHTHEHLAKPKEARIRERFKLHCDQCPKILHNTNDLIAHKIQDHGQDPLECDICSDKFESLRHLTYHRNEVHLGMAQRRRNPSDSPVMCTQCGKILKNAKSLSTHMTGVHSGAAFPCAVCGKTFKDVRNLKKHEGSELCKKYEKLLFEGESGGDSDPSVLCTICDKRFASKRSKVVHDRVVHSGEVFPCDKCGRNFSTERIMKAHQNTKLCRNTALGQNSKQTLMKYQGAEHTVRRKFIPST